MKQPGKVCDKLAVMTDVRGESDRDNHIAWVAGHAVQRLIASLGIGEGSRQEFAIKIIGLMEEQAEKIVRGEEDAVTGLSLNSVVRRNIAEHLKNGEAGVVLDVDMVGLKHFNAFSHEAGDSALGVMAGVLNEFGFAELGRKGDEFYGFMPNVTEVELDAKFSAHMEKMRREGRLVEPRTGLKILSYWVCGDVGQIGDLDEVIGRLDSDVEGIKQRVGRELMGLIDKVSPEQRAPLMMLYFNLKRRADGQEIASLANAVGQDLLDAYGIPAKGPLISADILEKIPEALKVEFHEMQSKILADTHIGSFIRR